MHRSIAILSILLVICKVLLIGGCENDAKSGALIGAGVGTAIGAIAGGDSDDLLIGAGIGAVAGYLVGNESDKKKSGN
jgi:hypothetical protein